MMKDRMNLENIKDTRDTHALRSSAVAFLSYTLIFAWMIFIFYMSAQPGDVSGDTSGSVSHLFMKIWNVVFFQGWSEAEVLHMAELWDYPIRKLAHMTEFGILAMLVYWGLGQPMGERIRTWFPTHTRYITAWIFTVIYAATDEIHQLFVPDRSGNGFDVCVDAVGALLALVVVWGIPRVVQVCKSKLQIKK